VTLRIGIINIMPRADEYEGPLRSVLDRSGHDIAPVWIRLSNHAYRSTDPHHLARHYLSFPQAMDSGPFHGVILTGAPVEEIPFGKVNYWPELSAILDQAGRGIPSFLGLCWGGLALARHLGIEKEVYPQKLFGVFATQNLAPQDPLMAGLARVFPCPQSRHAGLPDQAMAQAQRRGTVRLLARADETGVTIFCTPDLRFVGHLGHPEYPTRRLAEEYFRDRTRGRADVPRPAGYDPDRPVNSWEADGISFFRGWLGALREIAGNRGGAPRKSPPL